MLHLFRRHLHGTAKWSADGVVLTCQYAPLEMLEAVFESLKWDPLRPGHRLALLSQLAANCAVTLSQDRWHLMLRLQATHGGLYAVVQTWEALLAIDRACSSERDRWLQVVVAPGVVQGSVQPPRVLASTVPVFRHAQRISATSAHRVCSEYALMVGLFLDGTRLPLAEQPLSSEQPTTPQLLCSCAKYVLDVFPDIVIPSAYTLLPWHAQRSALCLLHEALLVSGQDAYNRRRYGSPTCYERAMYCVTSLATSPHLDTNAHAAALAVFVCAYHAQGNTPATVSAVFVETVWQTLAAPALRAEELATDVELVDAALQVLFLCQTTCEPKGGCCAPMVKLAAGAMLRNPDDVALADDTANLVLAMCRDTVSCLDAQHVRHLQAPVLITALQQAQAQGSAAGHKLARRALDAISALPQQPQ